jgi:class 3 adenylate cyclase
MERDLTLEDLAARTGEPADDLREWARLGLLGVEGGTGFGHEDVERVRLIRLFLVSGIPFEHVVHSARQGDLALQLANYLDARYPGHGRPAYTLEEAAAEVGLDIAAARRIWKAAMLGKDGELLGEDDLGMLRTVRMALATGLPEEALLQMSRTWTETLGRAAEVAARMVHFYVHEGPAGDAPRTERARMDLEPLLEPTILYFLRKGMVRAQPGDMVLHLKEEIGRRDKGTTPGQLPLAIVFVDLSSFTPLAEAMGDAKAAEILERFAVLVRECVGRHDGQVVKQIGDGFMLMFHSARAAIACALDIEERAGQEPQFPAVRSGVHWGTVLYREGDYVGTTVNVASRVAAQAQRHQVLVSSAARKEVKEIADVEFVRVGERQLKGVAEAIDLFEARRGTEAAAAPKVIDPVCGMELGPGEISARVSLNGREYSFCSQECLRRLVAAPERYET